MELPTKMCLLLALLLGGCVDPATPGPSPANPDRFIVEINAATSEVEDRLAWSAFYVVDTRTRTSPGG